MTKQELKQKLYERYIKPTEKKSDTFIGVEVEMPIVNLRMRAVDFDVVHSLTAVFLKKFGFLPVGTDEDGHIYSAEHRNSGDVFSYDCSYNNLEISFGKESSLFNIHERFLTYYRFIQDFLSRHEHTLTGMGINPYRQLNNNIPIKNGRYKMLYHHLKSYSQYRILPMYFHPYPNFGMFSSASQVQLDVGKENLPKVLHTFNRLEPLKAVLFANSVLVGENEDLLCCRDMLWENSTHGINPHNIGMYDCEINTLDDILNYMTTLSIYCVERDGHYINFHPTNIVKYFNTDNIVGEYEDKGRTISLTFRPQESDLAYLRTFKLEDLTFRGTVEFRSVCCQPISDVMTVSAFHLGLLQRVDDLAELLDKDDVIYHNGYTAAELRKLLVHSELPNFIDEDRLYHLIEQVLDIAAKGLCDRALGEEKYLLPLYERVYDRTNPAKVMLQKLKQGETTQSVISDFASEQKIGVSHLQNLSQTKKMGDTA